MCRCRWEPRIPTATPGRPCSTPLRRSPRPSGTSTPGGGRTGVCNQESATRSVTRLATAGPRREHHHMYPPGRAGAQARRFRQPSPVGDPVLAVRAIRRRRLSLPEPWRRRPAGVGAAGPPAENSRTSSSGTRSAHHHVASPEDRPVMPVSSVAFTSSPWVLRRQPGAGRASPGACRSSCVAAGWPFHRCWRPASPRLPRRPAPSPPVPSRRGPRLDGRALRSRGRRLPARHRDV